MANWTCDANEALTISLVRATDDKEHEHKAFHPAFTYPIYGEDETVYGYKNLGIHIQMASGSLATRVNVTYKQKLKASKTVDDVEGMLAKFLPDDCYIAGQEKEWMERVEKDAGFVPIGRKISGYTRKWKGKDRDESGEEVEYEVYHATLDTPGFKEYHRRMQLFILLYIEGWSYINDEEEGWEFVVLYEKRPRKSTPGAFTYHFVGYSSLYQFYCFPDRIRLRLSQFVIVPSYQRQAHGSELYMAIYNYAVTSQNVAELTVEDPAEAFEDLRDRNDLKMLLSNQSFMEEGFGGSGATVSLGKRKRVEGKMGPPSDKKWLEKWRIDLKIAGRQYYRLVEMLILLHVEASQAEARTLRAYRLQVKERLYRFNFETLMQLEKDERLEKLEETFQNVREDYLRILAGIR